VTLLRVLSKASRLGVVIMMSVKTKKDKRPTYLMVTGMTRPMPNCKWSEIPAPRQHRGRGQVIHHLLAEICSLLKLDGTNMFTETDVFMSLGILTRSRARKPRRILETFKFSAWPLSPRSSLGDLPLALGGSHWRGPESFENIVVM
jgi:hypothetical protein